MTRKPGPTEEPTPSIDQACRLLRLPSIRQQFPTSQPPRGQMSFRSFLTELLLAEPSAITGPDDGPSAGSRPRPFPGTIAR